MVDKQSQDLRFGIAYWIERVLEELDEARRDFAPEPVHDLRVAMRRCRSMAEGFLSVDPDPNWKAMRNAGKARFSRLGELRDAQVMLDWVRSLGDPEDKTAGVLLALFRTREQALKADAAGALENFDVKQWKSWVKILSGRAARVPLGSPVFQCLALECWEQAHELHRKALRNRSKVAFHQLRIGLKKLRYIVENFLPDRHRQWGDDLKELQDILGAVHDLDVLWSTTLKSGVFTDQETRTRWYLRIAEERQRRIERYRDKMVGPASLWQLWRTALPRDEQLEDAVLIKLKTWASFLDPDPERTQRVAGLALELYDGMVANGVWNPGAGNSRTLLHAAAITHEVGRSKANKNHQKESARLIRNLDTPLGWAPEDLRMTALIARYHCGALPRAGKKALAQLPRVRRQLTMLLAGILRLVEALDSSYDGKIERLRVEKTPETMVLHAEGDTAGVALSEEIAAARHLLESALGLPIWVRVRPDH